MKKKNLVFLCSVLALCVIISVIFSVCIGNKKEYKYIFEVEGVTIDLTKTAARFYKDSYLTDKDVYDKFYDYAQGITKYLSVTNSVTTAYPDKDYGFQLEEPEVGEEIAILKTNMGDIYIRFFPEAAPKAVENFKTHAKNGYYDGITFHRIISNLIMQSGDPTGKGDGGQSIWGEPFENEYDQKLSNFYGSIAMAKNESGGLDSQFFINMFDTRVKDYKSSHDISKVYADYVYDYEYQLEIKKSFSNPVNPGRDFYSEFIEKYPDLDAFISVYYGGFKPLSYLVPDKVWDIYDEIGGNISYDAAFRESDGHTVFAQIFKGLDVVQTISKTAVDENFKPQTDIIINDVKIITYTK